jgi:hypothetical protein
MKLLILNLLSFFRVMFGNETGAITIGMLRSITHDLVLEELADSFSLSSAGFRKLYENREILDGGYTIGSPVIAAGMDNTTGGWYQGSEDLVENEKDDITKAYVDWCQIYESVLLSKLDIMKNNGKSQILRLLTSKIAIAKKRMAARLAQGVFNDGTTPKAFIGLQKVISNGTYANLSAADIQDEALADAWVAYQKTAAGAYDLAFHQQALGEASEGDTMPHWVFQRQNVFNELWGKLQAAERILSDESKGTLSGAGHNPRKVLIFNGLEHFIDNHMKAQAQYFVNKDHTKLYVHSMEDMEAQRFDKLEKNNAVKERILLTGNLFCNNRRTNSSIEGITVAA